MSNLPPGLSEEQFRAAANQTVNLDDCVDYFFYVAGKSSATKRVKSYCVMNFKNPQDLFEFAQKFNGHLFVDTKGVEFVALVEYAPFQRLPKPRRKPDARQGTILQDEDYLKFVEELSAPVTPLLSAEAQLEKRLTEEKELIDLNGGRAPAIMSPLLLEMLQRKKARAQKKNVRDDRRKGERRKKRKEAKEKAADGAAGGAGATGKTATEKRERARKRDAERKERKAKAEKTAGAGGGGGGGGGRRGDGESKRRAKGAAAAAAADPKAPSWVAIQKQLEPGEIRIATREKPLTPASSAAPAAKNNASQRGGARNFVE